MAIIMLGDRSNRIMRMDMRNQQTLYGKMESLTVTDGLHTNGAKEMITGG